MKRRIIATILAVLCCLAAIVIMLYPAVSSYVNEKYRSEILTAYVEQLSQTDDAEFARIKELAVAYNQAMTPGAVESDSYSQAALLAASEGYDSQLNPTGDGTMGYIEIPKMDVYLPIFHGTGVSTLECGIGHLLGSSLPVGGENTHTILTGHSGMASQKMFTDLSQMEIGDVFYLHVLNETLAYQVDDINTVLPYDTTYLQIAQGQDYCTLVTCTPIGVNTHRLLVRGTRIPYEEAQEVQEEIEVQSEKISSNWEDQYVLGLFLGVMAVLVIAIILVVRMIFLKLGFTKLYSRGGRYLCKDD